MLDPTLLFDGKDWRGFAGCDVANGREKEYCVVYQIHNDSRLGSYALSFAKHVGLPLYRVSASLHQISRAGRFVYLPELKRFLRLIAGCRYLVTDSFHGTAFAINFNRQFIEVLPNNKTGSRNQSILALTGLTDRIVTNYDDFSIADRMIDYDRVNGIMEMERRKSIGIMKSMLE